MQCFCTSTYSVEVSQFRDGEGESHGDNVCCDDGRCDGVYSDDSGWLVTQGVWIVVMIITLGISLGSFCLQVTEVSLS